MFAIAMLMREPATARIFAMMAVGAVLLAWSARLILLRRGYRVARSGLLMLTLLYVVGPVAAALPFLCSAMRK